MSHIFISYSRRDKRPVGQFVEHLQQQDFIVWQDVSNISAGEVWHQALLDAIEQASAVLVFWSQPASVSKFVNEEIDHALKHGKLIIPVWLDSNVPLRAGLDDKNAVLTAGFSLNVGQKLSTALLDKAPRIQREVSAFDPRLPMSKQSVDTQREVIGKQEYIVAPLVSSVYSRAQVIAEANTTVAQVTRIQLMIQNTRDVGTTMPRQVFASVMQDDEVYKDEAQPLVGLYITGAINPADETKYYIDPQNVAHYSDMIGTTRRAIKQITTNAEDDQLLQVFQQTLVDISFMLGVQLGRWIPFQLFKWDADRYVAIANIPPRDKDR